MVPEKKSGFFASVSVGFLIVTYVIVTMYLFENSFPESQNRNNDMWNQEHQYIEVIVSPKFSNGSLVVHKNVSRYWNQPFRKWNGTSEVLASIHIPKTGGSSLDQALNNAVLVHSDSDFSNKPSPGIKYSCRMQCIKDLPQPQDPFLGKDCDKMKNSFCCFTATKPIVCGRHFDWSLVQEGRRKGFNMAPLIMFRHPVDRVLSHFYHTKYIDDREWKMKHQNLSEYLSDITSMMESRFIWFDGEVRPKAFCKIQAQIISGLLCTFLLQSAQN